MTLTSQQIESIAALARLQLQPEEIAAYQKSLSSIIDLVGQLDRADTSAVEPMAHPLAGQVQRLRTDEPASRDGDDGARDRERFQRNAAQVQSGLYLVPRVIE